MARIAPLLLSVLIVLLFSALEEAVECPYWKKPATAGRQKAKLNEEGTNLQDALDALLERIEE